ncbi:hypothetical protein [Bacillus sp. MRMR6]|uniref:hypothetical protein n=1 Tax=Bacillus sp. MRMR6 TaxID=1928617 RepID=UPI000952F3EE|nr:hypothetical protein [Bacillus sp. MRMR6]OLS37814.1 hypothetical protein BTR25_14975 [Bacillus sp. MRMR6]
MNFNEVMALILPSIIALHFYSKVIRGKLNLLDVFCHSALFMVFTNAICYAILIYLNKTLIFDFTNIFTLKYSLMATFVALIIVVCYRFLELNIRISLRVESKDEEK